MRPTITLVHHVPSAVGILWHHAVHRKSMNVRGGESREVDPIVGVALCSGNSVLTERLCICDAFGNVAPIGVFSLINDVLIYGAHDLADVLFAPCISRGEELLPGIHCDDNNRSQYANDAHDDEELDEGKTSPVLLHAHVPSV